MSAYSNKSDFIHSTSVKHCAIWYHLYNLKNVKNIHGGVLLLVAVTLLKVTLLHWCFSRFLNCKNGTKSQKTSQKFALGQKIKTFGLLSPTFLERRIMIQRQRHTNQHGMDAKRKKLLPKPLFKFHLQVEVDIYLHQRLMFKYQCISHIILIRSYAY